MGTQRHRNFTGIFILSFFVIWQSCSSVEKIRTERSVRVDSVEVKTMTTGAVGTLMGAENSEMMFEDKNIQLKITRVSSPDAEIETARMPIGNDTVIGIDTMPSYQDWLSIDYTIKPETVRVKVPQKTITEKTETTVVEKEMPNWGWIVIGILGGFLLVILIGAKVMR